MTDAHKHRIKQIVYAILAVACAYIFFKQTDENKEASDDLSEKIAAAQSAPAPHPLLINNLHQNRIYVQAIEQIQASDHRRLWAVSDFLDPTFTLNYFIYPHELVMDVEMQKNINFNVKIMQNEVGQYKPSRFDGVIIIRPGHVELMNKWVSSP